MSQGVVVTDADVAALLCVAAGFAVGWGMDRAADLLAELAALAMRGEGG